MSNPNEELTPRFKNVKPLRERPKGIHTSDNEEEAPKDNKEEEEPKDNSEEEETGNEEEPNDNEEEPKDNEEEEEEEEPTQEEPTQEKQDGNKILEREPEVKIAEYIKETLEQILKGENMLDDMKSFMDFVRILPQNMFDENIEYYATVLSNATINGVKLFDDISAARDFINDVRKKRRSRKWLRPKAQKQIKQEIQKNLQISPMMSKNIKHRTNAINVYQY